MEVEFEDPDLERLETDRRFEGGYAPGIVKAFRMRMQFIRASADERNFASWRALRFEKLKGDRADQFSMRLNDQWRLILKLRKEQTGKIVVVISIADYH